MFWFVVVSLKCICIVLLRSYFIHFVIFYFTQRLVEQLVNQDLCVYFIQQIVVQADPSLLQLAGYSKGTCSLSGKLKYIYIFYILY